MIIKIAKKFLPLTLAVFLLIFASCSKRISFLKITPKDALDLLKGDKKAVLIDVRTEEEYRLIRIPGSLLIPDYEIREKFEKAVPDKNTPIILYCTDGTRSANAAKILVEMGYTKVFDLGGILDWPYDTDGEDV